MFSNAQIFHHKLDGNNEKYVAADRNCKAAFTAEAKLFAFRATPNEFLTTRQLAKFCVYVEYDKRGVIVNNYRNTCAPKLGAHYSNRSTEILDNVMLLLCYLVF